MKPYMCSVFFRLWTFTGLASLFFLVCSFTYQLALPGRKISFPQDHFSHPNFKTEWWYYTGHLETEGGKKYGYQVTFFRFGLRDRQSEEQSNPPLFTDLYLAHFALSDKQEKRFFFSERSNRGYREKAGASVRRYLVWNEDWKVEGKGKNHIIEVIDRETVLKLNLTPLKPPVLHGKEGLSQKGKGEGRASYYYSLTRLKTEGELEIAGKKEKVGGYPGFKLIYSYRTREGLRKKGIYYGVLLGDWYVYLYYEVPTRYYFPKDQAVFNKVNESFKILETVRLDEELPSTHQIFNFPT